MRPFRHYDPAEAIRKSIERDHCIPVDIRVVGEDPGNRAIRSVAVYRIPDSMYHSYGMYVVMDCWDRTRCKDAEGSGLVTSNYVFGATRADALASAAARVGQLMADYTWFAPGTDELVPGCWGYME